VTLIGTPACAAAQTTAAIHTHIARRMLTKQQSEDERYTMAGHVYVWALILSLGIGTVQAVQ
jgi:hypothetical protein